MRTLAIGDIHGCLRAFDALLDCAAPTEDDTLVLLGDYVDRGPNSRGVMERIIQLSAEHEVVALQGNHEQMMREARFDRDRLKYWLDNGGAATLKSYSPLGDAGKLNDIPAEHWDFISRLPDWYTTGTHFFVHAGAHPKMNLMDQSPLFLRWEHFDDPPPHASGKIMICGHTAQRSGVPRNIGHAICIDTWVYGSGWLTCLDPRSGRVWQSNELGQTRTAWVDEFRIKH